MSKTTGKRREFGFYILPVIEEMGLKRVIEQIGIDRVVQAVCQMAEEGALEKVIRRKGLSWLVSQLTPEQRRALKELLEH